MKLKGKFAIIPGAASGIGKEIAFIFAREGAKIAVADMNKAAAAAAVVEIGCSGGTAIGIAMDVNDERRSSMMSKLRWRPLAASMS
jgi:3-hydroxybutyrate dehydrogenase